MSQKKLLFDSSFEEEFYEWGEQAQLLGLIKDLTYSPCSYNLLNQVKYPYLVPYKKGGSRINDALLLNKLTYTPDFSFFIEINFMRYLDKLLLSHEGRHHSFIKSKWVYIIIDVKSNAGNKFKTNSSSISFPIKQKLLFYKENVFVNKLVPDNIFKKTWAPDSVIYKKSGELRNNKRTKGMVPLKKFRSEYEKI